MRFAAACLAASFLLSIATGADASDKVKGGNGCTIVRKVTVFSLVPPPPASVVPDERMATLEQWKNGGWEPVASAPLDASGRFSFKPGAGDFRVCLAGPQGACYAGSQQSPVRSAGGSISAACPAAPGSDAPAAIVHVGVTPQGFTGDCPACGKSVASGTNNAR